MNNLSAGTGLALLAGAIVANPFVSSLAPSANPSAVTAAAASDINFDSKVDGADLSQILNDWGNAPRHHISPSLSPLNLINP